jgi:hypothetical protein
VRIFGGSGGGDAGSGLGIARGPGVDLGGSGVT